MERRTTSKRVCVIGGGIAGLVSAKVLRQDGFEVTLFEKEPTVGGVWASSRIYPGLRTNNPRETYAFSDLPYPEGTDEFPTAEQVHAYLESYVDHFELRGCLRLGTEVVCVSRAPESDGFQVDVRPSGETDEQERHHFDFVVVCNGVFSEPRVPRIANEAAFRQAVLHSSDLSDPQVLEGKRVVVVGAGKSALDCATMAGRRGASSTLVFRRPHWILPRYLFGRVRMDSVFFTRWSELLLPAYHGVDRKEIVARRVCAPLLRGWWRMQNWLIPRLCGMPEGMVPNEPLPSGVETIGIGEEFYQALAQGLVGTKRGRVERFSGPDSLRLDTGEELHADVVVFATGWRQHTPFLEPTLRDGIQRNGRFHLYRHILPPEERRLGFVGYASSSACPFTSELSAHWLSQCFRGEMALPEVDEMDREIAEVQRWAAEVFPDRSEGYFIGAYVAHYADELMRDMGLPRRRARNPLSEYLAPLWPERYRNVAAERRRARLASSDSREREASGGGRLSAGQDSGHPFEA